MSSQLQEILNKNKTIKKTISKYSFGDSPFIDDSIIKGGYRVVRTVKERNAIDCCHRKLGMKVMVIGQDYSYKDYILKGEHACSNDFWVLDENGSGPITETINDSDVTLLDDYSDLEVNQIIETQQDLNRALSNLLKTILSSQLAGDKNYVHDQYINDSTWIINHPLNKKVSVTVTDTAGTVVEGEVTINNGSQVVIKFNAPFKGEAILN